MQLKPMTDSQFLKYQDLIYRRLGILYKEEKRDMLLGKVSKHMRAMEIEGYDQFFQIIRGAAEDDQVWTDLVDDITIHTTNYFRERNHFDYISRNVDTIMKSNPRILQRAEVRGWSSACSTGEEAYTMAMVLKDSMGDRATPKVLATDVSKGSVAKAIKGEYRKDIRKDVDPLILQRYFTKAGEHYRVNQEIRRFITFRSFNLAEQFPFRDSFDIIFCRNVMIYFSPEMQQSLLNKLYRALTPGGLLFIGHSESLIGKVHRFQYIQPTVYMR